VDAAVGVELADDLLVVEDRVVAVVEVAEEIGGTVVETEKFVPAVEGHHCLGVAVVGLAEEAGDVAECLQALGQDRQGDWYPGLGLGIDSIGADVVPKAEGLLVAAQ
jgi:hypothetical protein